MKPSFATVFGWLKRNWLWALLILALLWLGPYLITLWVDVINKLISLAERAGKAGSKLVKPLKQARDFFQGLQGGKTLLLIGIVLSFLVPPLGFLIVVWSLLDYTKGPGRTNFSASATLPPPTAPTPPDTAPPTTPIEEGFVSNLIRTFGFGRRP